eukprot:3425886-Amphidinium_carterae.1
MDHIQQPRGNSQFCDQEQCYKYNSNGKTLSTLSLQVAQHEMMFRRLRFSPWSRPLHSNKSASGSAGLLFYLQASVVVVVVVVSGIGTCGICRLKLKRSPKEANSRSRSSFSFPGHNYKLISRTVVPRFLHQEPKLHNQMSKMDRCSQRLTKSLGQAP